LAGGVPGPGVVAGGVKEKKSNKPSKQPGMYENGAETTGLPHFLPEKLLNTPFFYLKVIDKIYSQDVL
jgi:hypothetical protein